MSDYRPSPGAETATAIAGVLTIGGVLTFVLFPFLLPILLLTGVFAAPLLAPVVILAVLGAPIAALVFAVGRLRRRRLRDAPAVAGHAAAAGRRPPRALSAEPPRLR